MFVASNASLMIKHKLNMEKQRTFVVLTLHSLVFLESVVSFSKIGLKSKDYCDYETFNPTCGKDEVVVIEKAEIGIMKAGVGTCIENDYGLLGCSSNQLGYMDILCSGRRGCEVNLSSKEIKDKITCPFYYLNASYFCQKVTPTPKEQCHQPVQIHVKFSESYLASIVTKDKKCGSGSSPWVLQAQSGQMINLTLIDFAWGQEVSVRNNKCQRQYGHILRYDNNDVIDICGGPRKTHHIDLITSHQVQIVLQESAVQSYNFLIRYKAIGCPDIIPPKNSWMRKDGMDVTIGCHSSSDIWKLKCVGNHWIGVVGNCSQATLKTVTIEQASFTGHHVMAFAVGCFALIICVVTITIGAYCVRRYKIKLKSKTCNNIPATNMRLLPPSTQNTGHMRTLSTPQNATFTHRRQGSSAGQTLPHPELQGLHMCGPNCMCSLNKTEPGREKELSTDDSVLYYVLEQPPIYENNQNVINS